MKQEPTERKTLPQTWTMPATALAALLLLAGCSENQAPLTPGGDGDDDAISSITAENALALTGSSLDMIGKVVVVGNIANTLVQEHIDLLSGNEREARDIAQCADSPDGYANETNRIDYRVLSSGYAMPSGQSLHAGLSTCAIEGVTVSGFIDITAIDYQANGADWQVEAEVFLNPVEILNGNGTQASLTDHMHYTAVMDNGVLTTTLAISADVDLGVIGGLNTQHYVPPIDPDTDFINYQFRPFRIRTVDDSNTGDYTVAIEEHAEGASMLIRYTSDAEISLRISTTSDLPVLWQDGRPAQYDEVPASGEIQFTENCTGCGSILATVDSDGIILTVAAGSGVVTEEVPWTTLLAPPDAP